MSGIAADWMRKITDIQIGTKTITLSFDDVKETYPNDVYAVIIRDSHFQSIHIRDLVIGDKFVEVYQE